MTSECSIPFATLKQRKKMKSVMDMLNPSLLPNAHLTFLPIKKAKFFDQTPALVCF